MKKETTIDDLKSKYDDYNYKPKNFKECIRDVEESLKEWCPKCKRLRGYYHYGSNTWTMISTHQACIEQERKEREAKKEEENKKNQYRYKK